MTPHLGRYECIKLQTIRHSLLRAIARSMMFAEVVQQHQEPEARHLGVSGHLVKDVRAVRYLARKRDFLRGISHVACEELVSVVEQYRRGARLCHATRKAV